MNTIDPQPVAVALDRLLGRHQKGGLRSRAFRLTRDELLPLCGDIANPALQNTHVFAQLRRKLGDRCPGRSALYRFAELFMPGYLKVRGELDGAHLSPALAAIPLREVARRLCVKDAAVQQLIDAGRLRSIDVGGFSRVPLDSLEALLAGSK